MILAVSPPGKPNEIQDARSHLAQNLGVYFILEGSVGLAKHLGWVVVVLADSSLSANLIHMRLASAVGVAAQLTAGLYLFFGGKWIVDKAIPGNRPYCLECGYDLTAATGRRCSECGTPFKAEDVEPRTGG